MGIELRRGPNDRILELGGGGNPCVRPKCMGGNDCNVDVRMTQNAQGQQTVDFEWSLDNTPLPIADMDFDGVVSVFALEHVSWRKVPDLIAEMLRVIKPGGKCVCVIPNTEEQIKRILSGKCEEHKDGPFIESSRLLYGDQDYKENSHSTYFSPALAMHLFSTAGFENITITPYGEIQTDMVVLCNRPVATVAVVTTNEARQLQAAPPTPADNAQTPAQPSQAPPTADSPPAGQDTAQVQVNTSTLTTEERAALFGKAYFNGGYYKPWHWDEPRNEIAARHVLLRKPESVLELGCSRGYLLKRLEDAQVRSLGLEISKHCHMTRVAQRVHTWDVCIQPWDTLGPASHDLCLSVDVLDRIPSELLPQVVSEMSRVCKRGLHAIMLKPPTQDPTRCTVRDRTWWLQVLPKGHEVVDYHEFTGGNLPPEYLAGDGKVKLNVGSYMTMFHHGWVNMDVEDVTQYAQQFQYKFQRWDARNGLPYKTGGVDLIYCGHMLEHLTYEEGLKFLKECRRVIAPGGAMRIIVPDAQLLAYKYIGDESDGTDLDVYDEINDGCANAKTPAAKMWSLLFQGHQAAYDGETLKAALTEAGFLPYLTDFRCTTPGSLAGAQILKETLDTIPCLSLYCQADPLLG